MELESTRCTTAAGSNIGVKDPWIPPTRPRLNYSPNEVTTEESAPSRPLAQTLGVKDPWIPLTRPRLDYSPNEVTTEESAPPRLPTQTLGVKDPWSPTTRPTLEYSPDEVAADDCWIAPGHDAIVGNYNIPGGMLYVGKGLASVAGYGVEPALIDPSLPINRLNPDRIGSGMTYWPAYSSITPECRAGYLNWLVGGRRDPSAYIGYVFLYFYGLERRAFADSRISENARLDLRAICQDVEQLLQIYANNNSFQNYAIQFHDALKLLMMSTENDRDEPPTERTGYELPISLRVGIGRIVADGKPLPADWALSWFLLHPETTLRTPARRCPEEFRELFSTRYRREFGDGIALKPNRSKLKITLTPASASFGGQVELSTNLPDIAALSAPISKLRQIGDSCAADLDAFSRWVGRNSGVPKTIAAVALLPSELATTHQSEESEDLWNWVKNSVGQSNRVKCDADDLLSHCASFGSGKLAKSEAVLLAQLLEKGGYGIEPDVRFGGAPLEPGSKVVIFKLPPDAAAVASPRFAAAAVLLHLAVAVSVADGSISESEKQTLETHLEQALALSAAERLRLSAHLVWLMTSQPSLTGLKKRLEPLDLRQRGALADFIITVAGADGQISPDEIRTLGKIYPMLGLTSDDVYSHIHAMAAGAVPVVDDNEPITVISARPSTGYAIPPPPGSTQTIRLDMATVKTKLAESAQVAAILDDIFTDDDTINVPQSVPPEASASKVPASHRIFLSELSKRSEWSRTEFEVMAAECGLMPDGAIDILNEAAFAVVGAPVIEGDDPMQVDAAIVKELVT